EFFPTYCYHSFLPVLIDYLTTLPSQPCIYFLLPPPSSLPSWLPALPRSLRPQVSRAQPCRSRRSRLTTILISSRPSESSASLARSLRKPQPTSALQLLATVSHFTIQIYSNPSQS